MKRSERQFIAELLAPLASGAPGAFGLTDDAALLAPPAGRELVLTKDALVEGVHFLADDPPELVAKKLLRVNLSDLAAKGAAPLGWMMAAFLPTAIEDTWLERFVQGLAEDQAAFGLALWGGDTVATTGPLSFSATLIGTIEPGAMLRRSGAKPGDLVFVSGTLGDAALWLITRLRGAPGLTEDEVAFLQDRYRLPQPRLALGRRLIGLATAAADVSDGLMADLGNICRASKIAAHLAVRQLPLSYPAERLLSMSDGPVGSWTPILAGGDDYELVFTVPPEKGEAVIALAVELQLPLSPIGVIHFGDGLHVFDSDGSFVPVERSGWDHFGGPAEKAAKPGLSRAPGRG